MEITRIVRRGGSRLTVGAAGVGLALSMAGCGGPGLPFGGASSTPAASASPRATSETAGSQADELARYDQCMQQHGVGMPAPVNGRQPRPTGDASTIAAARQACAALRPPALGGPGGGSVGNGGG